MALRWIFLWIWVMLLWSIAALVKVSCGYSPLVPEPLYGVALALAFEATPTAAVLFLGVCLTAIDITNGSAMGPHIVIYTLLFALAERLRFQFNINKPVILFFLGMLAEAVSQLAGNFLLGGGHSPPMHVQLFDAVTAGALAGAITPFVYAATRMLMNRMTPETKSYNLF